MYVEQCVALISIMKLLSKACLKMGRNTPLLGQANKAWAFPKSLMKVLHSLTGLETANQGDKHWALPPPDTGHSPNLKNIFSLSFTRIVKD